MAKFIDVKNFNLRNNGKDIVVKETILLNIEEIKWIEVNKFSNGYAIIVVTNEDNYAYDCGFERENEAYENMFELQRKLNK